MRKLVLIIFVFVLLVSSRAQQVPDTTELKYRNFFLPSPSVTYSPETEFVFGAYGLFQFKFKDYQNVKKASVLQLYASQSQLKQTTVRFDHKVYYPSDKWYFEGLFLYRNFVEKYYGIGHNTSEEEEMDAAYETFSFDEKLYRQIKNSQFYVGLNIKYINYFNLRFTDAKGKQVDSSTVPGGNGSQHLGLGLALLWDKRNSLLTPTEKFYLELSSLSFVEKWTSPESFNVFKLDARSYFNFNTIDRHVLAFQFLTQVSQGDVPFREMALLGGPTMMRGFSQGRFRDHHKLELQSEYRLKLYKRFGMTGFMAVGNVMNETQGWNIDDYKLAYGLGFRYNINKRDPANIRLDFGFGKNTKGVYITFGEAF